MLSAVCIFLTLYLYYRFTEIQHSNLNTQNKVLELQHRLDEFLSQQEESKGVAITATETSEEKTSSEEV